MASAKDSYTTEVDDTLAVESTAKYDHPTYHVDVVAPPNPEQPGNELTDEVTASASPNIIQRALDWLGHEYTSSFWGSIAITGTGLALIGLLTWHALGGGSSTPLVQSASAITSPQKATAAVASMGQQLDKTSTQLAALGYNSGTIQATSQRILLNRGTTMALASASHVSPQIMDRKQGVTVGAGSPEQFAAIQNLNMKVYLNSLANNDIPANNAAVHQKTFGTE